VPAGSSTCCATIAAAAVGVVRLEAFDQPAVLLQHLGATLQRKRISPTDGAQDLACFHHISKACRL